MENINQYIEDGIYVDTKGREYYIEEMEASHIRVELGVIKRLHPDSPYYDILISELEDRNEFYKP